MDCYRSSRHKNKLRRRIAQHYAALLRISNGVVSLRHDNSNDFNITFAYTVERFVFLVVYRIESSKQPSVLKRYPGKREQPLGSDFFNIRVNISIGDIVVL